MFPATITKLMIKVIKKPTVAKVPINPIIVTTAKAKFQQTNESIPRSCLCPIDLLPANSAIAALTKTQKINRITIKRKIRIPCPYSTSVLQSALPEQPD